MNKKLVLGVGLALSLFGVTACGESSQDGGQPDATSPAVESTEEQPGQEQPDQEQPELPEPDLEDVPEVVATVNGEEISREQFVPVYEAQFQQLAVQSQMSGQEVDQDQLKQQVADNLVATELFEQEADSRGIEVSQSDVDDQLDELAETNQLGSAEDFIAAMGEQGLEEDELRSQLRTQIKVEELVSTEAGDIEPTEEELRELYDEAAEQQEALGEDAGEFPAFEDVRPQLEEQVRAQKESEVVQEMLTQLRDDADITINL